MNNSNSNHNTTYKKTREIQRIKYNRITISKEEYDCVFSPFFSCFLLFSIYFSVYLFISRFFSFFPLFFFVFSLFSTLFQTHFFPILSWHFSIESQLNSRQTWKQIVLFEKNTHTTIFKIGFSTRTSHFDYESVFFSFPICT